MTEQNKNKTIASENNSSAKAEPSPKLNAMQTHSPKLQQRGPQHEIAPQLNIP
jgi:hypothetical protein